MEPSNQEVPVVCYMCFKSHKPNLERCPHCYIQTLKRVTPRKQNNLISHVKYLPKEGPRLIVYVEDRTCLDITPTSYNGIPLTRRWQMRDAENFSCYGEWNVDPQRSMGFTFDTSTKTLVVGKGLNWTHLQLGKNFEKILDLLFGPSEFYKDGGGPVFCNPDDYSKEESLVAINGMIDYLIAEETN